MRPNSWVPNVILTLDIGRDVRDAAWKGPLIIGEAQIDGRAALQAVIGRPFI